MRKILLILSVMTLPIQAEEAKNEPNNQPQEKKDLADSWTGWKLALNQSFNISSASWETSYDKTKGTFLDYIFGGAVEYGWSLQENLYIGVNTDVNFNWTRYSRHDDRTTNNLLFIPKLTFKGGFTQGNAMAFLGAGLGYRFVLSEPSERDRVGLLPFDKDGKQRHVPTWHIQVGGRYKISAKTFVGITWEYDKTFAKDDEITTPYKRKNVSIGESRLIFKVGMQF